MLGMQPREFATTTTTRTKTPTTTIDDAVLNECAVIDEQHDVVLNVVELGSVY